MFEITTFQAFVLIRQKPPRIHAEYRVKRSHFKTVMAFTYVRILTLCLRVDILK